MVTRRRFLTLSAAGVVSAGILGDLSGWKSVFASVESSITYAKSLNRNLGKRFIVRDPESGRKQFLKLIEVKDIKNPLDKKLGIERESFSLLFEGQKEHLLEQGVYEFSSRSMPDSRVLVVPVTADPGIYEVNFNFFKS